MRMIASISSELIDFDYKEPEVKFRFSQVNKVLFTVQSNCFHSVYLMCSIWNLFNEPIFWARHSINSPSILLVPFRKFRPDETENGVNFRHHRNFSMVLGRISNSLMLIVQNKSGYIDADSSCACILPILRFIKAINNNYENFGSVCVNGLFSYQQQHQHIT